MTPFNKELFDAGHPVCYRNGEVPNRVIYVPELEDQYVFKTVTKDDDLWWHTPNGRINLEDKRLANYDLMMADIDYGQRVIDAAVATLAAYSLAGEDWIVKLRELNAITEEYLKHKK